MTKRTSVLGWRIGMVGVMTLAMTMVVARAATAEEPDGTIGPDVVVWELPSTLNWGASGGIRAYSVGTTSCNRGDEDLSWVSSTNQHPVIAQNLYRVTLPDQTPPVVHGKIEMLGISWLKHGFLSLNNPGCVTGACQGVSAGSFLGVGCSDPYSASLNGGWSNLGPRSEVNAFTGYFVANHASPTGDPTIYGRVQVKESDLITDPATVKYFVEGQYVAPDDAGWPNGVNTSPNNGMNNASHREVTLGSAPNYNLTTIGATQEGRPAIYAWQDLDPAVTIREVLVANEGLFIAGYKIGDNGDGTWHYEYAVFNLNSDLSGRSFSVPILMNSVITNLGFRDVDYHSGEPYDLTDWAVDVDPSNGSVKWSSVDFPSAPGNANALRWSTMYTFSFDADSPPQDALASIGLFKTGGPPSVAVYVQAPATNLIPLFADDFETGDTSGWSSVEP